MPYREINNIIDRTLRYMGYLSTLALIVFHSSPAFSFPITNGMITNANTNKTYDFFFAPAILLMALLSYIYKDQLTTKFDLKTIGLRLNQSHIIIIFTCAACSIASATAQFDIPVNISILIVLAISGLAIIKNNNPEKIINSVSTIAVFILINLKVLSSTGSLLSFLLANIFAALLILNFDKKISLPFAVIFTLKNFIFNENPISDLFHQAETFLSYESGFSKTSYSSNIFPNVGWLEEAMPNAIYDAFRLLSLHHVNISLQEAHSWIALTLLFVIYKALLRNNTAIAFGICLVFPIERLSLLLVTAISAVILANTERFRHIPYFIISISPLLFLSLSPSYSAIIILSYGLFFWTNNIKVNELTIGIIIALILSLILNKWILDY